MTARDKRSNQDRQETGRIKQQADRNQQRDTKKSEREEPIAVMLIGVGIVLFFGAWFGPALYFLITGQIVSAILFGVPWLLIFGLVATVLGGG
jgi:hypothetical protein